MENNLGITLKNFVVFKVKLEVEKFNICYRKIYKRMLKSYVKIEFDSIFVFFAFNI